MFVLELQIALFNHYSFHLVKLYLFLSLFLSSAVTVSFDRLSYTVAEDEILELCLMFQGELEHFLELNISLLSDSAGSKLNYCVVCLYIHCKNCRSILTPCVDIVEHMHTIGLC